MNLGPEPFLVTVVWPGRGAWEVGGWPWSYCPPGQKASESPGRQGADGA